MNKLLIGYIVGFSTCIILSLLVYINRPYNYGDVYKTLDIYLEKEKPTKYDYYRLDVNKDGSITLLDGVMIINEIKR